MSKKDQVMAAFKAWDTDGNGTISEDELKGALTKLGMNDEEVKTCFEQADLNKDGVVDYDEFITWVYDDPNEAIQKLVSGAKGLKSQATCDALESAGKAVGALKKGDITELKSLGKPPEAVCLCVSAVCILFGEQKPDWKMCQKVMANQKFLSNLLSFDPNTITPDMLTKLEPITSNAEFTVENMAKKSKAAAGMAAWVLAMKAYASE